jgi:hypothetical protein
MAEQRLPIVSHLRQPLNLLKSWRITFFLKKINAVRTMSQKVLFIGPDYRALNGWNSLFGEPLIIGGVRIRPEFYRDSQAKNAAALAVWRGFSAKKHAERRAEDVRRGLLKALFSCIAAPSQRFLCKGSSH